MLSQDCDINRIVERTFKAVAIGRLESRPTHLQSRPEIARYGEATAHRNLTVKRIPVRTACTATHECLCTLCSGARLRIGTLKDIG